MYLRRASLLATLFLGASLAILPAQSSDSPFVINTIAGSDPVRDGGTALEALFDGPGQLLLDADGNLFVVDRLHHSIRKITPAGAISTAAGSPTAESTEDETPAEDLFLSIPSAVAVGADGTLYVADSNSPRVWSIDADGVAHIFAGTGSSGFSGDDGPAAEAELSAPSGLAVDGDGNVYIADTGNNRIRKVTPAGTISTIAGDGEADSDGDGGLATEASLNAPTALVINEAGEIFVADSGNHKVRKIAADGNISTVAGTGVNDDTGEGGPATAAALNIPNSLALDSDERLYIAESERVLRISASGMLTRLAGGGTVGGIEADGGQATLAQLTPAGIAIDANQNILLSDLGSNRIRRVTPAGVLSTFAGAAHLSGDGGPATEALLFSPNRIALDGEGGYYLADTMNNVIRHVDEAGTIETIAGTGVAGNNGNSGVATAVDLSAPKGVAADGQGNVYIADTGNYRILRVDPNGQLTRIAGTGTSGSTGDGGPAASARFLNPVDVKVDSDGNLYVVDRADNRVRQISPSGTISAFAGTGTAGLSGDGGPATAAELDGPLEVLLDEENEQVFIADSGNSRVAVVNSEGMIDTVFEITGSLTGIARDTDGSIYYVNSNNAYISRVNEDGEDVAVTEGGQGFFGDGGPASEAKFQSPEDIAIDEQGNLYVSDQGNHRIRLLTAVPVIAEGGLVNAGSFAGTTYAANSIVALFGVNLADETVIAATRPLPTTLGGVTVTVTDNNNTTRPADLFFVSRQQINLMIPDGTVPGNAELTVTDGAGNVSTIEITIVPAAAGIFSADASGSGVAAANTLKVDAQGGQTSALTFQFVTGQGFQALPISLGSETDQVYLTLYGTGIRGNSTVSAKVGTETVDVLYAGAQGDFFGLDQINIGPLPRSLAGKGSVPVVLTVNGIAANTVTVTIQ